MLLKVLLSIIVLGILFKYVRHHGCGVACPRGPAGSLDQRGVSVECTCVCATCPCSPLESVLQAFDIVPGTFEIYQNKMIEWVTPRYERSDQQNTQYSDPDGFHSPIVIEQTGSLGRLSPTSEPTFRVIEPNLRASDPNFSPLTQVPEGRSDPMPSSSKLRHASVNTIDQHTGKKSEMCNKCKAKGLTCMRSCPKAKPRNEAINTDPKGTGL